MWLAETWPLDCRAQGSRSLYGAHQTRKSGRLVLQNWGRAADLRTRTSCHLGDTRQFFGFCSLFFLKCDSNFIFFYILIIKNIFLLFWGILYVVFWSHWPSPPVSSRSTSHSILTKLCVLILKKLVLPINSWVCDAQLLCVHLTGGHTLKESSVSLFLQLSVITNSSLSGGTSWLCDFSMMGPGLARAWAGLCAVSQPLWVRVCNCPAMSKTHFSR